MKDRRLSTLYILAAFIALFGCAGPQVTSICDIVRERDVFIGERVRIQADGVFTRHGAYLRDSRCPDFEIVWDESEAFKRSEQADDLSSAAFREQFGEFRDIRVDVVGRVAAGDGDSRLVLVVERLFGAQPVEGTSRQPAPMGTEGARP